MLRQVERGSTARNEGEAGRLVKRVCHINPGLTTVDQFIDKMGYVATEMLVSLIQGNSLDSSLYKMPTRLIIRDSCRAL